MHEIILYYLDSKCFIASVNPVSLIALLVRKMKKLKLHKTWNSRVKNDIKLEANRRKSRKGIPDF